MTVPYKLLYDFDVLFLAIDKVCTISANLATLLYNVIQHFNL